MDLSLLCTDESTPSPTAHESCQTSNADSRHCLQNPIENRLFSCRTGAETMSEVSDQSNEIIADITKSPSEDEVSGLDCLKPASSICNGSESLSLDDEGRAWSYFGSSAHVLAHLSNELFSTFDDSDFKQPTLPFSPIQESSTLQPFGALSSTSSTCLMEQPDSQPRSDCNFISDNCCATFPCRSMSHHSDNIENDTVTAPVSDLYIFEFETHNFNVSPTVDHKEIKCPYYNQMLQTRGEMTDPKCDSHITLRDSENVVTQCHRRSMLDHESDRIRCKTLTPHAVDACEPALMSVNDAQQVKAEVTDLIPDNPDELWMDACQYLSCEDEEERNVLDKAGQSVMQEVFPVTTDVAFPARETSVSGYSPDGSEGIGCSADDTMGWGPQVKRWSSVDSWASALSDWTEIITAPPEDLTAAFTEIGAEIDALRQALAEVNTETPKDEKDQQAEAQSQQPMGVQDQPLKTKSLPESSVLPRQRCLPLGLQDREGSQSVNSVSLLLCDTTATTQGVREPEEIQNSMPDLAPCTPHLFASIVSPIATVAPCFGDYGAYFETDASISNNEDPIILNIVEDTDLEKQKASAALSVKEPYTDEQLEVTDKHRRSTSTLGWVDEQEAQRSFVPVEADRKDLFLTRTLTKSPASGVDAQPGKFINAHPHMLPDTSLDSAALAACQLEPQWESPKFITPLAPLNIGSSHPCQTSSSVRGDQTCVGRSLNVSTVLSCRQHCPSCSNSDVSIDEPSLEGGELTHKKENTGDTGETPPPEGQVDLHTAGFFAERKTTIEDTNDLSKKWSNLAVVPEYHFFSSKEKRVTVITLDIHDPFVPRAAIAATTTAIKPVKAEKAEKMPQKTNKSGTEGKVRPKKDKPGGNQHGPQASKTQENLSHCVSVQQVCNQQEKLITQEKHTSENTPTGCEDKDDKPVIDTAVATEKASSKSHGKKKKKYPQNTTGVKSVGEPLAEVENGAKPKTTKGRADSFEAKQGSKAVKVQKDTDHSCGSEKKFQRPEAKGSKGEQSLHHTDHKDHQHKNVKSPVTDDIKRRRLSGEKFGKTVKVLESKLPKPALSVQAKRGESNADSAVPKKAYSEIVKQKIPPKEEPKVVKSIQAEAVRGDPQSLCLWCQFTALFSHYTITWSRDGTVLAELKRSAGDESRVSLTISGASHKDLGKYQCRLTSLHGSATLDYLLTYEVLGEIVIPASPKTFSSAPVEAELEEEDVQCSRLIFKEDFLSNQYFGENQPVSIITEKVHFGEGMHRRAFRTKLQGDQIPLLLHGHSCVLKVHNSISHGTKNNEELIKRNFNLAVEECHVQNTAREYIKAYTTAAQSVESFGEIPEIIPIYLVHRPSNNIPYATLEDELIGDFVKYSVKDGKEINLMRRDSEAGQKCCAFQHWVYHKTEGNLLVTDMQGVGMKLTDVGIATSKKGYKGFKGNCATSFIDQFKALHQCNKYCEILGLRSLQAKAKKPASALKAKPQPSIAPKKKIFGPTVKGKS